MSWYFNFAAVQLDTEEVRSISEFGLWTMGLILVIGTVYILWESLFPIAQERWEERGKKAEADRNIEFDLKKSVLYRGHREVQIPENSLEYFVCKLVFEEIDKPQLDLNVLEAAGKDILDQRAIEQAVRRVNKKAKANLQLKNDLLLRRKQKTLLNDIERLI